MTDDQYAQYENPNVTVHTPNTNTDAVEITQAFDDYDHSDNEFKDIAASSCDEVQITVWDDEIHPRVGDVLVIGKAQVDQYKGSEPKLKINNSSVVNCYSGDESPTVDTESDNHVNATGIVPDSFDGSNQSGVRTVDPRSHLHDRYRRLHEYPQLYHCLWRLSCR